MKVLIVVYQGDEWKRDTLESRMVDVRIERMVAEFTRNHVPIEVIRQEEMGEWARPESKSPCLHEEELEEVGPLKSGLILLRCGNCNFLLVKENDELREIVPKDFEEAS